MTAKLEKEKISCIFFDGKNDKLLVKNERFGSTTIEMEEHYTITDPYDYVTHFNYKKGEGAKGISNRILVWIDKNQQKYSIYVVGADSTNTNTGWKGGVIQFIEKGLNRKVLWDICCLHLDELPLCHIIINLDGPTTGENSFKGVLGQAITNKFIHLTPVNNNFEKICIGDGPVTLPEDIEKNLSTDQKYLYKIVKMIRNGVIDKSIINLKIGPVDHARWLTTACRFLRLYVSTANFHNESTKTLKTIVEFIIFHYSVMWFA